MRLYQALIDEMRSTRRDWINYYIHWNYSHSEIKLSLSEIIMKVRESEFKTNGRELNLFHV